MWTDDLVLRGMNVFGRHLGHLLGARRFPLICFIAYMAPRIAVLFVGPVEQFSDLEWYYQRAVAIASGAGYSQDGVLTAFWPVGWPGLLGGLFSVTGPSVLAAQLVNLVLSALVFVLTAAVATAMFGDRMVGRAAVLILSAYPNQIAYIPFLTAEIFYEFLLLLSLYLLMRERFARALLAGLVFGVATLTKAQTLLLPGFILAGVFLAAPSRRSFTRLAGLSCAVYVVLVLVVAPWTYRDYMVFHAFIPVSTNGGWTFLTGNNPEATGGYMADTVLAQGITHDPADQVTMDHLAWARGIAWIEQNPGDFLWLLPKKLLRLWGPDGEFEWYYHNSYAHFSEHALLFRASRILNQAFYFAIWLLALPAAWRLLRGTASTAPWVTVGPSLFVYFSLISLVFSGQSRFHFSLMPIVVIYAAWSLVRFIPTVQETDRRSPSTFGSTGQDERDGQGSIFSPPDIIGEVR